MGKKNNGGAVKNGPQTNQKNKDGAAKEVSKKDKKSEGKNDHSHVTLLAHPILTLKVLFILLGRFFTATFNFIVSNLLLIVGFVSLIGAF